MKTEIKEFISSICQKLNIATDNRLILEDIGKSLATVDVQAFRTFLNANYTKEKYNFKWGIKTFDLLVEDFKRPKVEENNNLIESYCTKLIKKIEIVERSIYMQSPTGFNIQEFIEKSTYEHFIVDNRSYFNEKEQTLINSVGGLPYSLNAFNSPVFKIKLEKECKNLQEERRALDMQINKPREVNILKGLTNEQKTTSTNQRR